MKKNILLIVICSTLLSAANAQISIGTPTIKNYSHTDYNASTEIWGVNQDKNGILYFANNDGLLTFDGSYWKIYPLPNKASIKSIAIDPSGKIFVGGQDEIGYFFPDKDGILKFHSLKHLMPLKARQFADIWNIVIFNNEVFFRTIECIFEFRDNEIKTFDAFGGWRLLTSAGSQLYADDKDEGLMIFKGGQWQHCCDKQQMADLRVTGIMDYGNDTLLVATFKKGLFFLNKSTLIKKPTVIDAILYNDMINCAKKIGEDRYAIGTTANGLFILNGKGKLIEQFSNNDGLQNNNVYGILLDDNKNIWLSLENGLGFINYDTSIKHIYPSKDNQVKGNAVSIFDNKLFIGTSNGLYSVPLDSRQKDISINKGVFTEINNTKGRILSLSEINGQLLIAHQDGAMVVHGNGVKPITSGHGVWMFKAIPFTGNVIAGTYTGFQLLKYEGGDFKNDGKINGIYESLGNLATDNNNFIWATHPYRGVYKIQLSADKKNILNSTKYTEKNGLPSILNNHVYFIKNKVTVATQKGVYEYDATKNKFYPSAFYKPIFGNAAVEYLTDDASGNIWFISEQRVGVIDFGKPTTSSLYSIIYFPELAGQTVKGAEYIYPYNMENIFIGSNNGVFHLNYSQYAQSGNKLNVLLSSVKAIAEKDSLIYGGFFMKNNHESVDQDIGQITSLANHWNSFHFEFSSTLYAEKSNQEFSYKLIGFDQVWSKWSVKTEKDYTNLPYGWYTFSVKARNNLGQASAPVNYTFIVKPAWYQTVWAYLVYLSIAGLALYYASKLQQRRLELYQKRHEEEQQRLSYLHSLELDRNEKEIMALKNENLESELNYKNKELATITMHLVDRGRLLLNIKEELNNRIKKLNAPDLIYQFRSVFKLLSDTEKNDDDWKNFAIYFDEVHNNFLSTVKAKFPCLSSTDLKLCAYLRLNLTSKEIAQLLNISLKGVEISRYRVRKKLQLSTDINLYDFLIDITNLNHS
ncbi:MAG: transcriptional regulator [Mucilaginibacter sp.]|nr:transcriptional regulator [Mucilaginibacter sp.]